MLVILIQRPKIKDLMLYDVNCAVTEQGKFSTKKEWGNHFSAEKQFNAHYISSKKNSKEIQFNKYLKFCCVSNIVKKDLCKVTVP